jgi:glycosyltransferase involved in cell wall biosynthesis
MLNLAFVANSTKVGGADRCLLALLDGLDRSQVHVTVILPGNGPLYDEVRSRGMKIITLEMKNWVRVGKADVVDLQQWGKGLDARVEKFSDVVRSAGFDLVMTNSIVCPDGALAAMRAGVPHVWNILEMLSRDPDLCGVLATSDIYRLCSELSDRIIVVSDSVAEEFSSVGVREKVTKIHTGLRSLERSEFQRSKSEMFQSDERSVVFTFVGLLSRRKGVLDFIEASVLVCKERPNAVFVIAGADGGLEKAVRHRAVEARIQSNVRLLGFRTDALAIIASSDALVLPSLADPLPVSVIEAMHLGVPVVATRSGGAVEMVVDGLTGYVIDPSSVSQLAAAMLRLAGETAEGIAAMGEQGRIKARGELSESLYVERFMSVVAEVRGSGPRRHGERHGDAVDAFVRIIDRLSKLRANDLLRGEMRRRVFALKAGVVGSAARSIRRVIS